MKIRFHPEARDDLREAKAFYRKRSPLAAVAFAQHIDGAIARIREAPARYPMGERGTREHVLPSRFPYTVVYRLRDADVVIIAIAHHSREPGYWRDRR